MTWDAFLKTNKERYRVIRTSKDLEDVPEGIFLIVSTSMLGKLKRSLARFIKLRSRKCQRPCSITIRIKTGSAIVRTGISNEQEIPIWKPK